MPFSATWMDHHTAVTQTETNIILYHFYVESKKSIQMVCIQNKNRLADMRAALWLPKGKCDGGRS